MHSSPGRPSSHPSNPFHPLRHLPDQVPPAPAFSTVAQALGSEKATGCVRPLRPVFLIAEPEFPHLWRGADKPLCPRALTRTQCSDQLAEDLSLGKYPLKSLLPSPAFPVLHLLSHLHHGPRPQNYLCLLLALLLSRLLVNPALQTHPGSGTRGQQGAHGPPVA